MKSTLFDTPAERRKMVRLKVRPDLHHVEQRYEGKRYHVIKDPVCLRYYRFNQQEYFVFQMFDGGHTMEEVRKKFEDEYKPHRLEFQDLESFARQLVTAGLVQLEQHGTGQHLFQRRAKQRRMKRFAAVSNIMYWKIPVFDPDRLLTWMFGYLWWIFTVPFFILSVGLMLSAGLHVLLHFGTFYDKLPQYHEFFAYQTVLYMWLSLGVVKIIHEFGHGLSCKAFKGECHEMGVLLMCFSPALYANVTDAWTVADKWKRIIISFAGIYVELLIAAISTFVWWYTPHLPLVNNIAMCLMVLCSVSTIVFNANPLMRFDGYYMLADWIEIPNLRDRANRYLNNLFLGKCLGIETPPEQYMQTSRRILFVAYAITSWCYRWFVTFSIIWFLSDFLNPKLKVLSRMLAVLSLVSMFVWPTIKIVKSLRQRGRLPDMKKNRVYATLAVFALLIAAFLFVPLPISRVREVGMLTLDPANARAVGIVSSKPAVLMEVNVREGEAVKSGATLAKFYSREMSHELSSATANRIGAGIRLSTLREMSSALGRFDPTGRLQNEAKNAETSLSEALAKETRMRELNDQLSVLTAPITGIAMGVPGSTELGKQFEPNFTQQKPVMTIADPKKLIVQIPITPMQYHLIKEDLPKGGTLEVEIYVTGRTDRVYKGKLHRLPEADARQIPMQLTQRGGGSVAVKQAGEDGQEVTPVAQTYLVEVELLDPDPSCRPGALVHVKVYCKWRSAAWWVRWKLSEALDLGLYQ